MAKRKPLPPSPITRPLAPASATRGHALRAVLLAAAATAGGCSPRAMYDDASAAVHRAGVWIGVIDEPRAVPGQMEAVHPPTAPMPSPSTSAPSAALVE